jgi:hypothetical protein
LVAAQADFIRHTQTVQTVDLVLVQVGTDLTLLHTDQHYNLLAHQVV